MKKPPKEVLEELTVFPYKIFPGVDYQRIMSLHFDSIKIDVKDE